jgi:hypothetical protein
VLDVERGPATRPSGRHRESRRRKEERRRNCSAFPEVEFDWDWRDDEK